MKNRQPLGDYFRYNAKISETALERSGASYRYLIERRDRLLERMRVGALTLNAASFFGCLTVLQSDDANELATMLSPVELPLLFFLLGIVAAALSLSAAHNRFVDDASEAANELRKLQTLAARLASEADDRNANALGQDLAALKDGKVPEFSYSKWEYRFLSVSTSCWVAGLALPITRLILAIDWFEWVL